MAPCRKLFLKFPKNLYWHHYKVIGNKDECHLIIVPINNVLKILDNTVMKKVEYYYK